MLALIGYVLWLFLIVLFAYSILSWVTYSGTLSYDSPVLKVQAVLAKICEPVLRPVRRIIPPVRVGGASLDLSVLVVWLVILLLTSTVFR
jgi:YggT family protein